MHSIIILTLSHINDFYLQATWIHIFTDGSATETVQDGDAGSLIYLPNGQTLEAASATGKYGVDGRSRYLCIVLGGYLHI